MALYMVKTPMSAILDKPGGQNVSVTIPVGAPTPVARLEVRKLVSIIINSALDLRLPTWVC